MMIADNHLKNIKAVVFDVFGTLVRIGNKRHPYGQLLEKLRAAGRETQSDDGARIMSTKVGLAGVATLLGMDLPASEIAALELDLYTELASIELFPDTLPTLHALRSAGFKLALCSNLAAPYAVPVKLLLPPLDVYIWSFEAGTVKPDPAIYQTIWEHLGCSPNELIMVGDSVEADHSAPRRLGMHGFHLARDEESPVSACIRTLDEVLDLLGCRGLGL